MPQLILPTLFKCTAPFHTWAIELIVTPKAGGLVYVVVYLCIFSKWAEVGFVPDKESITIARCFHANITCCYGTPGYGHADNGGEFRGMLE